MGGGSRETNNNQRGRDYKGSSYPCNEGTPGARIRSQTRGNWAGRENHKEFSLGIPSRDPEFLTMKVRIGTQSYRFNPYPNNKGCLDRRKESQVKSRKPRFRPGDVVVYRKQKQSVKPGLHAKDIQPEPHGDTYTYLVDKFWRVIAVNPDNTLVVSTRKGKKLTINGDDPNLRGTRWWDRLFFWKRFPPIVEGD